MSKLSEAADAIRHHLKTLERFRDAVEALGELDSIENARKEAMAPLTTLSQQVAAEKSKLEGLKLEVAHQNEVLEQIASQNAQDLAEHQKHAEAIVVDATNDARKITDQALKDAQGVRDQAKWAADAATAKARAETEKAIAERNEAQGKTAKALQEVKDAADELATLTSKIAAAKGKIAELLK